MRIGIYGPGEMGRRGLNKHLGEFAPDDAKFVFAADDAFGEGVEGALRWALANYEPSDTLVLYPKGDDIADDLKAEEIPGEAVEGDLHAALIDSIDVLVLILADDDKENALAAGLGLKAHDAGIEVRDMAHAMAVMAPSTDEPEASAPSEPSVDDEVDPYEQFINDLDAASDEDEVRALMLDKANRDVLVTLAENVGIEVPAGTWQKTIAAQVEEALTTWFDGTVGLADLYKATSEAESAPEPPFDAVETEAPTEAPEAEDASEDASKSTFTGTSGSSTLYMDVGNSTTDPNTDIRNIYVAPDVAAARETWTEVTIDAAAVLTALDGDVEAAIDFIKRARAL